MRFERIQTFPFLELQPCHFSAEGYGFHQEKSYHRIVSRLYNCRFSIFLFMEKKISLYKRTRLLKYLFAFSDNCFIICIDKLMLCHSPQCYDCLLLIQYFVFLCLKPTTTSLLSHLSLKHTNLFATQVGDFNISTTSYFRFQNISMSFK